MISLIFLWCFLNCLPNHMTTVCCHLNTSLAVILLLCFCEVCTFLLLSHIQCDILQHSLLYLFLLSAPPFSLSSAVFNTVSPLPFVSSPRPFCYAHWSFLSSAVSTLDPQDPEFWHLCVQCFFSVTACEQVIFDIPTWSMWDACFIAFSFLLFMVFFPTTFRAQLLNTNAVFHRYACSCSSHHL